MSDEKYKHGGFLPPGVTYYQSNDIQETMHETPSHTFVSVVNVSCSDEELKIKPTLIDVKKVVIYGR